MKRIIAKKLSRDNFHIYGEFANLLSPEGPCIGEGDVVFYRDILAEYTSPLLTGFSTVVCQKRPYIIDEAERHMNATEILIPLDDDVVIFAAPAGNDSFPYDQVEAFIVPKGYMITFRPGVWHKAQYPINAEKASVVCILPERTYASDCLVVKFPQDKKIEIEL